MDKHEVRIDFTDIGKAICDNWGYTETVVCPWWQRKDKALSQKISVLTSEQKTLCVLAYFASKAETTICDEKFHRVREYLVWIEARYEEMFASREENHGKAPKGLRMAVRGLLSEFTIMESRAVGSIVHGGMRVVGGHLEFYGDVRTTPWVEKRVKRIFRSLRGKSKEKYQQWMKRKIKKVI